MKKLCLILCGALLITSVFSPATAGESASAVFPCTFTVQNPDQTPAAARLLLYDAAGNLHSNSSGWPFHLIDGTGEITLPAGRYTVQADAGMRRSKPRHWLIVGEGKKNALTLTVDNYSWSPAIGWTLLNPFLFNHPVNDAAAPLRRRFTSLAQLQTLALSAGLTFCGVSDLRLLPQTAGGASYAEIDDGDRRLQQALTASADCRLLPVWEVDNPAGSFTLIERQPNTYAEALPAGGRLTPVLAAARDRGALTVLTRPSGGAGRAPAAEMFFNLVAGNFYDAVDITRGGDDYAFWQFLLELGLRLPAVAGGGSFPNLSMYAETAHRTFAAEDFLRGLRDGRTLVSNGPFFRVHVIEKIDTDEGAAADTAGAVMTRSIGDTLALSSRPRTIFVDAYSCSDPQDSIARIELLYNGQVVESAKGRKDQRTMQVTWKNLTFARPGWLQVRYVSTAHYLWAVSNPIYIGTAAPRFRPAAFTNLRLTLKPAPGMKPPTAGGEIIGENFGTRFFVRPLRLGETFSCRLPATAEIIVQIPGRPPQRRSLYTLTGVQAYCEKKAAADTPRALRQKDFYEKMRSMLENAAAVFEVN